jgi:hypothetical protein
MQTANESPNYPNPSDQNSQGPGTDEVSFIRSQNCCVCFVDIVDSTRITSNINDPPLIILTVRLNNMEGNSMKVELYRNLQAQYRKLQ